MKISHILIPYTGNNEEQEMLVTACRIARGLRARVSIVHVLEVPMTLPVDTESLPGVDEANAILDQAEDLARSEGVKAVTALLQARDAGHAIVEDALERGADLIIMEARPNYQLGILILGETVDYVLKHSECPIWVSRMTVNQPEWRIR